MAFASGSKLAAAEDDLLISQIHRMTFNFKVTSHKNTT
jgi:hypothetical protein